MIGVGLVGYGYWGPNLARTVAETEGCAVAAVADKSDDALGRAHKRHPTARLLSDWRELVADPRVDAVVVATPVASHFDIALAALQAGKHVLVEKPIAESSAQASILIEEAAQRGLTLMVDHTFIYTGAVQKIEEMISSGAIGDIYYYDSTRINLGLFQRDVNVLWDLAVHDLAILDFVLPTHPVAVSASGTGHVPGNPENMAQLTIFFSGGAIAHLNVNWLAPVKIRQTLIGGSRRMIVYDDLQTSEKVKIYDRGIDLASDVKDIHKLLVSYRMGDMWSPQISVKEALLTEVEHFVHCIQTKSRPTTDGSSGLRIVEMLEAASQSMKQRGQPVDLVKLRRAS
ncbi:Gfo/Idh/MocA family protein [Inquilinus sp. NPDC058860]|uniref:Gfo/Idh/MocA family protein n=1 Tax=Inquilinus sp. NPDC058860 TaxID=3346652 RepID=UPI003674ACC5